MGEIEPDTFDVITNHDCIHDLVDPVGVLRTVRRALKRDGARRKFSGHNPFPS